jgi:stress-induced morphogen
MLLSTTQVKELVEAHIPDARVSVTDLTGTSDHFGIDVVSAAFEGKSPIERHKLVHAALSEHLGGAIHAVQIKASTP